MKRCVQGCGPVYGTPPLLALLQGKYCTDSQGNVSLFLGKVLECRCKETDEETELQG